MVGKSPSDSGESSPNPKGSEQIGEMTSARSLIK